MGWVLTRKERIACSMRRPNMLAHLRLSWRHALARLGLLLRLACCRLQVFPAMARVSTEQGAAGPACGSGRPRGVDMARRACIATSALRVRSPPGKIGGGRCEMQKDG